MRRRDRLLTLLLVLGFVLLGPRPSAARDEEGCLVCHGLPGFGYGTGEKRRTLDVEGEVFDASGHGSLVCRACHLDVVSIPHDPPVKPVNCGLDCHAVDEDTGKPYSHESIYWNFLGSVHGSGPGCLACHPRDPAPEKRERSPVEKTALCAGCHLGGARDGSGGGRVARYLDDAHGRMMLAGGRRAPTCPDCHAQHAVLPSSKESSATARQRLPVTCAGGEGPAASRACHRRAATANLIGMSPLAGRGWTDYPGGGFFRLLVILSAGLLATRVVLGTLRGR